jgi:hypothetical protein
VFLICTLDRTLKELGLKSAQHNHLNVSKKSVILSKVTKKMVGWNDLIIPDLMIKYVEKHPSPPDNPNKGYSTVIDLIRFLRNVFEHLDEYRGFIYGSPSSGLALEHIIKPFPHLMVECWAFVQLFLSKDPRFEFFFAN